jgi:hypothetical protein
MEKKYPYFNGRQYLVDCRDILSAFQAQLQDSVLGRPREQRDKYDNLVPVIDAERFSEGIQSAVKMREEIRRRDGPEAVRKVVELIDELLTDYDRYNETFKQEPPPKKSSR